MKILFAALLWCVPLTTFGDGLVSCTGAGGANPCDFCDFITMANNIVTFLFGILSLVAVIILVIAGIRLVTSAGNPTALGKAKTMFTNVIIGFIIVISAWFIVDTLMKALVSSDFGDGQIQFGVWNQLDSSQCGGYNMPTKLINDQSAGGFAEPGQGASGNISNSAPVIINPTQQINQQSSGSVYTPGQGASADISNTAPSF